uniref:Gypsy retrotransposon integrase-like protein 1 n=1 Tax=Oryzias melastigma TaxID=30732 RepID=A0A3B3BNF8_ORYME
MGCKEQADVKLNPAPAVGHSGAAATRRPNNKDFQLPRGLIGTRSTAHVKINGQLFNCLLDSGSQVTTIPHSFYNTHFMDHEIQSITDLLEIEGANGQSVPYLGYIQVSLSFPPDFFGSTIDLDTLALIVPDHNQSSPQILIGTNTLDVAYSKHVTKRPQFHPTASGYNSVYKILKHRFNQRAENCKALVTFQSNQPCTIHAGQTIVLEGCLATKLQGGKTVLVEHPQSSSLPGGLIVKSCLVNLPLHRPCHLPVVVSNESSHDVQIPARATLAEISNYQIISKEQSIRRPPAETTQASPLQYDFKDSPISSEWKQRIIHKLNSVHEVFAKHELDFGKTDKVRHQIKLSDPTPFKQRPRPIHPQDVDAVRSHLQDLLETGIIRESDSPFASPIVVVRKKDGGVRLCIDYRKLNLQTIKDAYALPKLEESFSALSGSKWFSVLDLKSGYYQIEMEEADKEKTAFVCPLGFWEFNRMPQGVTNAPSTFQRLMEKCVGELNLKEVLVFIDDIIVFAPTLEEHETRLMRVLNKLKDYGLKLSLEKCVFFQTSVKYLGHVVSQDGVKTDPDKISTLTSWPVPKTLKELRSFLGFAGYYRRFVEGYSAIVKPLHELTAGYPPLQKGLKPLREPQKYHNPKEPFGGRWTPGCQQAFDTIIEKLTLAPVLAFADPQKPYILHTDASSTGLGAILYQEHEEKKRVVAYASRGLTKSESRYPAHKLEFLALKWAVTEKFSDYLYGAQFTVVTDSNPLTYLLTTAKLDATSYRWLSALSTYNFKIVYRAGKRNADADGLSRRPHGELQEDPISNKEQERIQKFTQHHLHHDLSTIDCPTTKAVLDRHVAYSMLPDPGHALVLSISHTVNGLPDEFINNPIISVALPRYSKSDLAAKQRADPVIQHVIAQVECGDTPPPMAKAQLPDLPLLLREVNKMELLNTLLVRRRQIRGVVTYQLVLPKEYRAVVLHHLHDQMGHLGIERTLELVRSRFYWPRMMADIVTKIKTCERCVKRKSLPQHAAPLVNIKTTHPLELVCMDFLSVEPDGRTKDILVITDHFTKYAVAVPTPNQKARTVAKCLWDNFFVHYGIPSRLHSDQGTDFESKTIRELCALAGIHKIRTTPYHPRSNPVERFNRTLLDMLGTLTEEEKQHWKNHVKPLVHAYNCTKNDVTGFSPYELMFGRQPRLPIDLAFGLPLLEDRSPSYSEYVQKLTSHLEENRRVTIENAAKSMKRNKERFDRHILAAELDVGERVLVRNVRQRGKHKLADKWESTVYIVVEKSDQLPVYTVRPEHQDKPLRTLHRDLLLPCGFLSNTPEDPVHRRRQSPPVLPSPPADEESVLDEMEHAFLPAPSEPVTIITTFDIPTIQQPVPDVRPLVVSPPAVPAQSSAPVTQPSSKEVQSLEEEAVVEESSDSEQRSEPLDSMESIAATNQTMHSSTPEQCAPATADPSSMSVSDSPSPTQLPLRRTHRIRTQPERLQYVKPGKPLLKSIQTLLQGLSSAFFFALQDDGERSLDQPESSHNVPSQQMHEDVHEIGGGVCNPNM